LIGLCLAEAALAGPSSVSPPPNFSQIGLPNAAETRAIVEQFREAGFAGAGDCYLEFALRIFPRRGPERDAAGRLWAGRDDSGPVLRVELDGGGRFLLRGGPAPRAWQHDPSGAVLPLDLFTPWVSGADIDAFDVEMPFFYWPDVRAVGLGRILGRPANCLLFLPPPDFAAAHPQIGSVRAYLDTQYNAPVLIQTFAPDGKALKTASLVDLKKVRDRWIVKEADIRNEATRDKTRFSVNAADLGVEFTPGLFDLDELGESVRPPAGLFRF
jgi:hypothetical protein